MRILPVRLNQNINDLNKNKTVNLNTLKQNSIKSAQHNDVLDISFKGQKKDNLNFLMILDLLTKPDKSKRNALFYADFNEIEEYNKILGDGAPVIFQKATLQQDKNKQNVIHKLFIDTLKAHANSIGEKDCDENVFDFQSVLKMKMLHSVLKSKSSETIEKALLTQDKHGKTPLHLASVHSLSTCKQLYGFKDIKNVSLGAILDNENLNNALTNLIYALGDSLGEKAPEVFAKVITIQDKDGNTLLHSISKEPLMAIIDILGDSAFEALEKALLLQNKSGATPWFNAREGVASLYVDALSDRAYDVVKEVLSKKNKGAINLLSSATLEQLFAYKNALKNDTKECFKDLISEKNALCQYIRHSDADKIDFLTNLLGDDTPKIYKEAALFLKLGNTIFDNMPYSNVKSIITGLGDEAPDVIKEVFEIESSIAHFFAGSASESIRLYSNILGKEKSIKVFEKAMLKKSKYGFNSLHLVRNIEQADALSYALGSKRRDVFEKAMLQKNDDGLNPLQYIINPEILVFVRDILGDKAFDVFREAALNQSKYGTNVFFRISSSKLDFLIDTFGDSAHEIIKEGLLARDKKGKSMLSYAAHAEKELYKEYFGDKYDKIAEKSVKVGLLHRILNRYL